MTDELDHQGEQRYCPRCDQETIWTNVADGGVVFACTLRIDVEHGERHITAGCGLTGADTLSGEEFARLKALDEKASPPRRQSWQFV